MSTVWPTTLPDAQLTSLAETGGYPTTLSSNKEAFLQLHSRFPFALEVWQFTLQVTTSQLGIFETWWADEAYFGNALVYNWPIKKGNGRELVAARPQGTYAINSLGFDLWLIVGTMLIEQSFADDNTQLVPWDDPEEWIDAAEYTEYL